MARSSQEIGAGSSDATSSGYRNYVLGVLVAVYAINFLDRYVLIILLDPIKSALGASDTAMGFLTGLAFALFYTVAGIPIARLADRGTRRTIIAMGLAAWSTATALSGAAQNFLQLAVARVAVGVGEAAGSPPAHSMISDYFPLRHRATALSIYSCGIPLGIAVGYLVGGWVNEWLGWRLAFVLAGAPGIVLAIVVRSTVREPRRGASESSVGDDRDYTLREVVRHLRSRPSFLLLALGAGCAAFSSYGFDAWTPAFLGRVHHMQSGEIGTWLAAINATCGVGSYLLGGWVADRLGARDPRWYLWVSAIGIVLALPPGLVFLLAGSKTVALLALAPNFLFYTLWLPPCIAITHQLVTLRMRALASAILFFVLNLIGLGLGPQAVGIANDLLASRFGEESVRYSLLLVTVSSLSASVLFQLAARSLKRDLARPAG